MDMNKEVVVITGASTGIGAHTAVHLAGYNARLTLVARSRDKLVEVKAKCVAAGLAEGDVLTIGADVSKKEDITRIVEETVKHFGQMNHLINNAAVLAFEDVCHSSFDTFDTVVNTNLRAPLFLTKEAMPHLQAVKGSIINVSSVNSQLAEHICAMYCISKAALEHLTRVTANEVATSGVRVNAVVPGFVVTDTMLYNFPEDQKAAMEERFIGYAKTSQPLGGGVRMSAVAKSIHFLLGDGACAITGESIRVDNGYHLALPEGMSKSLPANSGLHNAAPTQERQAKGKGEQ